MFNFKPSKDPSNGTKKQEIWHTHPENLELLAVKEMKPSYKWSYLQKNPVKNEKTVCLRNKNARKLETLNVFLRKLPRYERLHN